MEQGRYRCGTKSSTSMGYYGSNIPWFGLYSWGGCNPQGHKAQEQYQKFNIMLIVIQYCILGRIKNGKLETLELRANR